MKGNNMTNQNQPGQQNQTPGQKPGQQQGGGSKPGQQSQTPGKDNISMIAVFVAPNGPAYPSDVCRCRQSRKHPLSAGISHFDPERTSVRPRAPT
jgi:hypothetical protein